MFSLCKITPEQSLKSQTRKYCYACPIFHKNIFKFAVKITTCNEQENEKYQKQPNHTKIEHAPTPKK